MSAPRSAARSSEDAGSTYRELMSAFPTGVAVVTAIDRTGRPHGMTCTSLASVAVCPPTLLVCLDLRSGTLRAVREERAFAVNLLHARGQRAAELFSSKVPDRFRRVGWRHSDVVGAPWLVEDAFAMAECRVSRAMPAADHVVVLGEVVASVHTADVPLLYGMRRFTGWSAGNGAA